VLSMGGMGYSLICLKSSDPTHRIYNISNWKRWMFKWITKNLNSSSDLINRLPGCFVRGSFLFCFSFWTGSHYVTRVGFQLAIPMSQFSQVLVLQVCPTKLGTWLPVWEAKADD
jgi:hypothetical protein